MFLELQKLKEYASGERQGAPPLSLLADAVSELERLRDPFPPGHLGDWCLQMRDENSRLRDGLRAIAAHHEEQRELFSSCGDHDGTSYHEERRNAALSYIDRT